MHSKQHSKPLKACCLTVSNNCLLLLKTPSVCDKISFLRASLKKKKKNQKKGRNDITKEKSQNLNPGTQSKFSIEKEMSFLQITFL